MSANNSRLPMMSKTTVISPLTCPSDNFVKTKEATTIGCDNNSITNTSFPKLPFPEKDLNPSPLVTEPPDSTMTATEEEGGWVWWQRKPFAEGEDILVHDGGQDGLIYFGIIVEVDHDMGQCLVRFGDCTERWSFFHELKRLGDPDPLDATSQQLPPPPPQPSSSTATTSPNLNIIKTEATEPEAGEEMDVKPVVLPEHVTRARGQLSYRFDTLVWDSAHQRNQQEIYCYCGESGDWYKRMLQCKDCLQWFHQECIRSLDYQLLCGDRFFEFTCTLCNGEHEETIIRLDLSLVDSLHLALFNLILSKNQKFHDLDSAVLPFVKKHLKYLQGMDQNFKLSHIENEYMSKLLTRNKSRFKCGSETGKKNSFWGLRKMCAPPLPSKYFPRAWGRWAPPSHLSQLTGVNGCGAGIGSTVTVKQDPGGAHSSSSLGVVSNKFESLTNGVVGKSSHRFNKRPLPPSLVANHRRIKPHHHRSRLKKNSDIDSDGGSVSGRRVALDDLIKPPKDFFGLNNPFRTSSSKDVLTNGASAAGSASEGSASARSSTNGAVVGGDVTPNSSLRKILSSEKSSPVSSGAPSTVTTDDSFAEEMYQNSRSLIVDETNVGDEEEDDCDDTADSNPSFKSPGIKLADLKGTLSSYFAPCAKKRIERGDQFGVKAKRLTLNGDIAYLIQWENNSCAVQDQFEGL